MTTAAAETYAIADIKKGERFRKELGDLAPLMASIEEVGILQPIVITAEGKLIAGARRLEAAKRLGWDEVPVWVADNVINTAKELIAERDENTCRLDMKPSEAARLGIAIEAVDEERRRKNKIHNLSLSRRHQGKEADKSQLPSPDDYRPLGRALETVAPAVGMSPGTYNRAKVVVKAAEDPEAPEPVREAARAAIKEMDRTGKVSPSWQRVRDAKMAQPPPGELANWDKTSNRYKEKVAKIIKGAWNSLNRLDVAAPGLAAVDMEVLVENLSAAELEDMDHMAANAVTALKSFQRKLKDYKPEESE